MLNTVFNTNVECQCWMPALNANVECQCRMPMLNANVECQCRYSMLNANVECQCWMPMLNANAEWKCWMPMLESHIRVRPKVPKSAKMIWNGPEWSPGRENRAIWILGLFRSLGDRSTPLNVFSRVRLNGERTSLVRLFGWTGWTFRSVFNTFVVAVRWTVFTCIPGPARHERCAWKVRHLD